MKLEQDYREPYLAWKQNPTPENTDKLLTAVQPVLKSAVRTYTSTGGPLLHARAKQLALDAFQSYAPDRAPLKSHLMSRLQRLRRYATREMSPIRVPEGVAAERQRLAEAERVFADRFARPPSDQELADHLGISVKRLQHVRQYRLPAITSHLRDETGMQFDPSVQRTGRTDDAWAELVYGDLPARDQYIMERSLGMHGHRPMSAKEIAKSLQITPAAVSQRMKRIQQQLDLQDELDPLSGS